MFKIKKVLSVCVVFGMLMSSTVFAGNDESQPLTYLFKYEVSGLASFPDGQPVFGIEGPGYSVIYDAGTGQISSAKVPGLQRSYLSNGKITFTPSQAGDPGYVARFTCDYDQGQGCHIEMPDGTILVADEEVALEGRLVNGQSPWGFVPSEAYDPMTGIFPQRILGCGGLTAVDGPKQGMKGSICFNGVFDVPVTQSGEIDFSRPLVGRSNCTITLHTPTFPAMPPQ